LRIGVRDSARGRACIGLDYIPEKMIIFLLCETGAGAEGFMLELTMLELCGEGFLSCLPQKKKVQCKKRKGVDTVDL
jgi:hypothetical protein